MQIKAGGKALIIFAIVGALGYGGYKADEAGYFRAKTTIASAIPTGVDLGVANTNVAATGNAQVNLPAATGGYNAKIEMLAWNAISGLNFANGGVTTTKGSLMDKRGITLTLERQDMYDQMIANQVKFAKAVAAGQAKPTEGSAFVIIMGDGYPAYVAGAQEALGKLGQQIEVIGAVGYSRGEDKCMLPPDVKTNPQKARGSLVGAVLRDGDWNICVKWAADNGIPVNPDEKTYDADAMNFVSVDDFKKADENYIAGYCETRPVVSNAKPTGEKRKVCQNGTATWTPGDVKVAREKGGVVAVASTKEYMWQMPSIIIGNKAWNAANPEFVKNLLAGAFEGGEAVRSSDANLNVAAGINAAVFKEENAEYWAKYFKGVTERDKTGNMISLGGSSVNGLGDNLYLFGLNGNDNLFKRVYTVFGNLASKMYPDILPKLVPYETVVNTTYLQALAANAKGNLVAEKPTFGGQTTGTFAKRAVSIEFETGKTTFTPKAVAQVNDLLDQLSISGLTVQINGHTDNIGNSESNLSLSKKRAEAVKQFIMANASSTFPDERVRTRGYGDTAPVASNGDSAGRAQNRRVEVILLTQ